MKGTLTIRRVGAAAHIELTGLDPCFSLTTRALCIEFAHLVSLARNCNIAVSERIATSEKFAFRVGPFPITGGRSPNFGELLVPNLVSTFKQDDLYPFQRFGVGWLASRQQAILADDMGLGKTVQVLGALREVLCHDIGSRVLVICPKTLIANWLREATRWVPEVVFKSLESVGPGSLVGSAHVIVCSYEQLRSEPRLFNREWDIVIADEAHRLRIGESDRVKRFQRLKRLRCWLLTGTPIENNESDLGNLLSILDPVRFSKRFLLSASQTVRPAARPYFLRRKKTDVLNELPQPRRIDVELQMAPDQLARYLDVAQLRDHELRSPLQRLAMCRALCDFEPTTGQSPKIDWLCNFVDRDLPVDEKVIVFSAYLPVLWLAYRRLNTLVPGSTALVSGETPADERETIVDTFQRDGRPRVLLLSLGVGAEGLTLVRANHVVFLNEWWNPSVNEQARDRLIRIGQHRSVFEYRLMMKDSVEQRVRELTLGKSVTVVQVVDALAGSGAYPPELERLFRL